MGAAANCTLTKPQSRSVAHCSAGIARRGRDVFPRPQMERRVSANLPSRETVATRNRAEDSSTS